MATSASEKGSRNRRADLYNLGYSSPRARFCSSPIVGGGARVCSPAIDGGARLAGSGGAIRRRIRVLSGGTDGSWIFSGGVAMRYVRLSFAAKGNRIFLFPAMLPSPGLLVRLATAGSFSGRWSDGRRGGFLSSSVRAARMAVCVQWIQGAGDGPRCWLLQLLPSSWGPAAWRKEDLAGLPSEGVAEDDDGDITGCVRQYSLYWGVSCKKSGMYCMLV